jgi:hypothetical protein
LTDESLNDKRTADRLKREIQAADAPKAWAAYVGQIQRTRARTATLREERLARETAALRASATLAPAARMRKSGAS